MLIESYGLEEYSNRELERAEEIFEKGYNTATELLDRLLLENGLSIRYSPVYSGTTACVVSLMVLWRKTVAEKWPISRQRL